MIKKLYHGSKDVVEKPQYGFGKKYNDYGQGFYCTDVLTMAKEWGASLEQDGYANCYELACEGLKILDLNHEDYNILHWLTILLQNREFDMPSALAMEAKSYLLENFDIGYEKDDLMSRI